MKSSKLQNVQVPGFGRCACQRAPGAPAKGHAVHVTLDSTLYHERYCYLVNGYEGRFFRVPLPIGFRPSNLPAIETSKNHPQIPGKSCRFLAHQKRSFEIVRGAIFGPERCPPSLVTIFPFHGGRSLGRPAQQSQARTRQAILCV